MTERLPVVVVDDKHDQLSGAVDLLEAEDWTVTTFDDIDEAARVLVEWTDPFVMVLDHDFDRPDGRTGLDLTELLRSAHPWGLILPICYWSGRIGGAEFLAVQRDRQLLSPSSYTYKAGDESLVDVVERAEQTFQQHRATLEQQALRRALLSADEDLLEEQL
jgi:CheY-like chemotaxis protein